METEKQPKNETKKSNSVLEKLWESGLPISHARFTIGMINGVAETHTEFNVASNKVGRKVEMRLVPQGVLCLQQGKYFLTPFAYVAQVFLG